MVHLFVCLFIRFSYAQLPGHKFQEDLYHIKGSSRRCSSIVVVLEPPRQRSRPVRCPNIVSRCQATADPYVTRTRIVEEKERSQQDLIDEKPFNPPRLAWRNDSRSYIKGSQRALPACSTEEVGERRCSERTALRAVHQASHFIWIFPFSPFLFLVFLFSPWRGSRLSVWQLLHSSNFILFYFFSKKAEGAASAAAATTAADAATASQQLRPSPCS